MIKIIKQKDMSDINLYGKAKTQIPWSTFYVPFLPFSSFQLNSV